MEGEKVRSNSFSKTEYGLVSLLFLTTAKYDKSISQTSIKNSICNRIPQNIPGIDIERKLEGGVSAPTISWLASTGTMEFSGSTMSLCCILETSLSLVAVEQNRWGDKVIDKSRAYLPLQYRLRHSMIHMDYPTVRSSIQTPNHIFPHWSRWSECWGISWQV